MPTTKHVSETIFPWLKENLGKDCLGVLTGQDRAALRAIVCTVEIYAYAKSPSAIRAFRELVYAMQPSARLLAYHSIAHVMDWNDRLTLWEEAGLGSHPPAGAGQCKYEPQSGERA